MYDRPHRSLYAKRQSKPLQTPSPILKTQLSLLSAQRILHEPKSVEVYVLLLLKIMSTLCWAMGLSAVLLEAGNLVEHTSQAVGSFY